MRGTKFYHFQPVIKMQKTFNGEIILANIWKPQLENIFLSINYGLLKNN